MPAHTYSLAGICKLCGLSRHDQAATWPCSLRPARMRTQQLMTDAERSTIAALYRGETHTITEIAAVVGRSPGTVSNVLHRLKKAGVVEPRAEMVRIIRLPPLGSEA